MQQLIATTAPALSGMPLPSLGPQLSFESAFTRRAIILSYCVVVLLALPIWWTTTSIDRLSLPAARVAAQQNREVRALCLPNHALPCLILVQLVFPVHVHLDTYDRAGFINAGLLAQQAQGLLDADVVMQEANGIRVQVSSEPTT